MIAVQLAEMRRDEARGPIERLNAVIITGRQLEAALAVLAALPVDLHQRPDAQTLALQAYAREAGFEDERASAALHARVTALAKWTAEHDPERQSNAEAVLEAAARFPLGDTDAGINFEPAGFQELVLFIEDLPF
jgi:hypothetical protein